MVQTGCYTSADRRSQPLPRSLRCQAGVQGPLGDDMRGVRGALAVVLAVLALTAPYAAAWVRPTVCLEPYIPCPKPAPDPAPPKPAPAKPTAVAYHGLGTWVDAYDYSREYGGRSVTPASVDTMAKQGVKTIYIQAAKD